MYKLRVVPGALAAVVLVGASIAIGAVQPASARPLDPPERHPNCGPGKHWDANLDRCVPNAPPRINPTLHVDQASQVTTRDGIRVAGWAADGSQGTAVLTILVSVDGGTPTSAVANLSRPDVAAVYPAYGPQHGYDVNVPASAEGHEVCVTAINVGGGGNSRSCRTMDDVVEFRGDLAGIRYDIEHPIRKNGVVDGLDRVAVKNGTAVQQSTTISNTKTRTDTSGWSSSVGLKVSVSGNVGIPFIAEGRTSVEGSVQFAWNGSTSTTRTFSWTQPVLVPPKSVVTVGVLTTRWTLSVPYTLPGTFVYRSGTTAYGSVAGIYDGINSNGLDVTLTQANLDGTPAAHPIKQKLAKVDTR